MKNNSKFLLFLSAGLIITSLLWQNPALAANPQNSNSGAGLNASYNWAGYVTTGSNITSVSGTWIVPQVPATANFSADAAWIGIGGVTGSDLIQTGTQEIVNNSAVTYQAWYELMPGLSRPISITVNPGDSISASITEQSANQWTISLRDNTNGQNFNTTVTYNSSLSSAEWVEEMPSQGNGGFIPLDNFGSISFSGGYAVESGNTVNIAGAGAQSMAMYNSQNQALATPSALGNDGASFMVSRNSAVATSPAATTVPYGRSGWRRVGVGVQGFTGLVTQPRAQRQRTNFSLRFRLSFKNFDGR